MGSSIIAFMTVLEDLRSKWDRAARWYDAAVALLEILIFRRLRRRLVARASGLALEVAAGTGLNRRHYAHGVRVVAVDLSAGMLARARKRGVGEAAVMTAESLAFGDRSFDTVVSTLATCTFPDPLAALREMRRVCRKGGRILLLEHGRSDRARIASFQDRHAKGHARRLGCWWNREPLEIVRLAGLIPYAAERRFFGMVHVIEAIA
jgi:ubiquinone/menaquinone biosynthesis C-methylase UbiE